LQEAHGVLLNGLKISRNLGDKWLVAVHLGHLGMIAYTEGNYVEAERTLRESVALWRDIGDIRGMVFSLGTYAMVTARLNAFDQADRLLHECLVIGSQHNRSFGRQVFCSTNFPFHDDGQDNVERSYRYTANRCGMENKFLLIAGFDVL